jgi:hypothetical protein
MEAAWIVITGMLVAWLKRTSQGLRGLLVVSTLFHAKEDVPI